MIATAPAPCITLDDWLQAGLTFELYKSDKKRGYLATNGRAAYGKRVTILWHSIVRDDRRQAIATYLGYDPGASRQHNALAEHFEMRLDARAWYSGYRLDGGVFATPAQVAQWTTNASVLCAVLKLHQSRTAMHKRLGHTPRGLWPSIAADLRQLNTWLQAEHGVAHSVPTSVPRLKEAVRQFGQQGWEYLVDGRAQNKNRQKVSSEMIELWQSIYAGQREQKPDFAQVHHIYSAFLRGEREVVCHQTGLVYDRQAPCYTPVGRSTVYNYQSDWEHGAAGRLARQGDSQKVLTQLMPHHRLEQPRFAGSIISVDDRQPPFAYNKEKDRMWFYNGIDLGSEAFTCWVYSQHKKDLILPFYRQLVRNYAAWGMNLPHEIECEMSLNSAYRESFLADGVMFQKVRMEANKARAKRIEAYYRPLRYHYEKRREGWLARPFALSESNQPGRDKPTILTPERIVQECLIDIERWNNSPHSNQELHAGMTRWQVFEQKQHHNLTPTNWAGILPLVGYRQPSSMHKGRIMLQRQERVVGWNGRVALGNDLIDIMKQIEGRDVVVYWIDDVPGGNVLKAMVYDGDGRLVCELLDDLKYQKAALEQSAADMERRELTSKYETTVRTWLERGRKAIKKVVVIDHTIDKPYNSGKQFCIPGLQKYQPTNEPARNLGYIADPQDDDSAYGYALEQESIIDTDNTLSRF